MADYSIYPDAIDGYAQIPLVVDNVTKVDAVTVNRLRSAIINIENELGTDPSGLDFATVKDRLNAIETSIGVLQIMLPDDSPTTILTSTSIGNSSTSATTTDSISVRGFGHVDFSFLVSNLASITEIRARVLYSLLESPEDYDTKPSDWNLLLASSAVDGIDTADAYTLVLDASSYPSFTSLPGSFGFTSSTAGLHMMILLWASTGNPSGSSFSGIALRRN